MLDMKAESLRYRLRSGASPAHDRLDARVTALDVATRRGVSSFLAMNHAAFAAMVKAGACGRRADAQVIVGLANAAEADLAQLGAAPVRVSCTRDFSPVAVDYVVLGSRMGTEVLRRRWQVSTDPLVRRACGYFSQPGDARAWRAFRDELMAMPGEGETADRILDDVEHLFALFSSALNLSMQDLRDG